MRVDRAPELLGARGHGPVHAPPGRLRRARAPSRSAQRALGLSLQGPRPAPSRRLTTNSRWTGVLVDPSLPCGEAHDLTDHPARDRRVCPPAVARTREEIGLRPHPAVVLTQGGEERWTEGDLAIATALALLDQEHHPLAIDVADLQLT